MPTGLVLSNGSPTTRRGSVVYHADNFRLTMNALDRVAGIPEPSSWALLILGYCAVGARLRRRRPRPALIFA